MPTEVLDRVSPGSHPLLFQALQADDGSSQTGSRLFDAETHPLLSQAMGGETQSPEAIAAFDSIRQEPQLTQFLPEPTAASPLFGRTGEFADPPGSMSIGVPLTVPRAAPRDPNLLPPAEQALFEKQDRTGEKPGLGEIFAAVLKNELGTGARQGLESTVPMQVMRAASGTRAPHVDPDDIHLPGKLAAAVTSILADPTFIATFGGGALVAKGIANPFLKKAIQMAIGLGGHSALQEGTGQAARGEKIDVGKILKEGAKSAAVGAVAGPAGVLGGKVGGAIGESLAAGGGRGARALGKTSQQMARSIKLLEGATGLGAESAGFATAGAATEGELPTGERFLEALATLSALKGAGAAKRQLSPDRLAQARSERGLKPEPEPTKQPKGLTAREATYEEKATYDREFFLKPDGAREIIFKAKEKGSESVEQLQALAAKNKPSRKDFRLIRELVPEAKAETWSAKERVAFAENLRGVQHGIDADSGRAIETGEREAEAASGTDLANVPAPEETKPAPTAPSPPTVQPDVAKGPGEPIPVAPEKAVPAAEAAPESRALPQATKEAPEPQKPSRVATTPIQANTGIPTGLRATGYETRVVPPATKKQQRIVDGFAKAGIKVDLVESEGDIPVAGAFHKGRIIINRPTMLNIEKGQSPDDVMAGVALHEYTHQMEATSPERHFEVTSFVRKADPDGWSKARETYARRAGLLVDEARASGDPERLQRAERYRDQFATDPKRAASDTLGQYVQDAHGARRGLERMLNTDRTRFQQFIESVRRFAANLRGGQRKAVQKLIDIGSELLTKSAKENPFEVEGRKPKVESQERTTDAKAIQVDREVATQEGTQQEGGEDTGRADLQRIAEAERKAGGEGARKKQEVAESEPKKAPLTDKGLATQVVDFAGKGGISSEVKSEGLRPAFLHTKTGEVFFNDNANVHLFETVPKRYWVEVDREDGYPLAVSGDIEAGFIDAGGRFLSRSQASRATTGKEAARTDIADSSSDNLGARLAQQTGKPLSFVRVSGGVEQVASDSPSLSKVGRGRPAVGKPGETKPKLKASGTKLSVEYTAASGDNMRRVYKKTPFAELSKENQNNIESLSLLKADSPGERAIRNTAVKIIDGKENAPVAEITRTRESGESSSTTMLLDLARSLADQAGEFASGPRIVDPKVSSSVRDAMDRRTKLRDAQKAKADTERTEKRRREGDVTRIRAENIPIIEAEIKKLKFTKQDISLTKKKGESSVSARVNKGLGIAKLDKPNFRGNKWTVTHLASGFGVTSADTLQEAKAAVVQLQRLPIDWTKSKDSVLKQSEGLNPELRRINADPFSVSETKENPFTAPLEQFALKGKKGDGDKKKAKRRRQKQWRQILKAREKARDKDQDTLIDKSAGRRTSTLPEDVRLGADPDGADMAGGEKVLEDFNRHWIKTPLQRQFVGRGLLPKSVAELKLTKEGAINQFGQRIKFRIWDFNAAARKTYGGVKKISEAELFRLDMALRSELDINELPEPMREPIEAMRKEVDDFSRMLLDSGMVEGPIRATIEENLGSYLRRTYRVFSDPKWAEVVDPHIRRKAKALIRSEFPAATENELEGIIDNLLYAGKAADSPIAMIKEGKLGSKDLSILMKRTGIPPEIRALMGEVNDPVANYANSIASMARMLTNHEFLTDAKSAGLKGGFFYEVPETNTRGKFIVPMAAEGSKTMEPLNGVFSTPEIAKAFKEAVEGAPDPGSLMRLYYKINGYSKYSKTVLNLMTHNRNFQGNAGFALAQGHLFAFNRYRARELGKAAKTSVQAHRAAFGKQTETKDIFHPFDRIPWKDKKKWQNYYAKAVKYNLARQSVHAGEVSDAIKDALGNGPEALLLRGATKRPKLRDWKTLSAAQKRLALSASAGKVAGPAYRVSREILEGAYRAEDEAWKLFAWEVEKARYRKAKPSWSEEKIEKHTANLVINTYPTYGLVSRFVRNARRFPFTGPFLVFPAEVARVSYNTIGIIAEEMKDPDTRGIAAERIAGVMLAAGSTAAISAFTRHMTGVSRQRDDDLRKFLPYWSKNSQLAHWGWNPETLTYRYTDLSYTDPFEYLKTPLIAFLRGEDWESKVFDTSVEALRPIIGEEMLAGSLLDVARNKKKTGGEVYGPQDDRLDQIYAMLSHVAEKALEPGFSKAGRRIYKGATGSVSDYGKVYDPKVELLAQVGGQRIEDIKIPQALMQAGRGFKRAFSQSSDKLQRTASRHGNVTDEQIMVAYNKSEKARRRNFAAMVDLVETAQRLGMSDKQVITSLRSAGVGKRLIGLLVLGAYIPYIPSRDFLGTSLLEAGGIEGERESSRRATLEKRKRLVGEIAAGSLRKRNPFKKAG